MTIQQEIEQGCGIWESMSESSKCVKDNLCSDCSMRLQYYLLGLKDGEKINNAFKIELEYNYHKGFNAGKLEGLNVLREDCEENWKLGLLEGVKQSLIDKDNHTIGCMLEAYVEMLNYRTGFTKEAQQLAEIASKLK
jgi:hypothetical protein